MARIAIFAMLPIVALLVWRDVVLERQLRLLAIFEEAVQRDRQNGSPTQVRDERLDAATWALVHDDFDRASDELARALEIQNGPQRPFRVDRIAAFIECVRSDGPPRQGYVYLSGSDQRACVARRALNKHDGGIVQK